MCDILALDEQQASRVTPPSLPLLVPSRRVSDVAGDDRICLGAVGERCCPASLAVTGLCFDAWCSFATKIDVAGVLVIGRVADLWPGSV